MTRVNSFHIFIWDQTDLYSIISSEIIVIILWRLIIDISLANKITISESRRKKYIHTLFKKDDNPETQEEGYNYLCVKFDKTKFLQWFLLTILINIIF